MKTFSIKTRSVSYRAGFDESLLSSFSIAWLNSGVNSLYVSDYDYSHEKGRDIGDVKEMEQPLKTGKTGEAHSAKCGRLREMRTVTDSFKWHNHAVFSEVYKL
ncbi:MAG: hypothetical protein ACLR7U_06205 [Ruthenibacterium lactatiformans]